jgi:ribosomal protein S10
MCRSHHNCSPDGNKTRVIFEAFDKVLGFAAYEQFYESLKNRSYETGNVGYRKWITRLPSENRNFSILRSPHVDKTSQEQFSQTTHRYLTDILLEPGDPLLLRAVNEVRIPGVTISLKYIPRL